MLDTMLDKDSKKQIPNLLTAFRFLVIPFFVYLLAFPSKSNLLWAGVVFILASITDWLDGYIARLYDAESILGKLLDPLADKVLVMAALVMLSSSKIAFIPAWLVVLLLSREFLVTGLRSLAAVKGVVVAASKLAKFKTATMMIALILLFLTPLSSYFKSLGLITLWISAVISVVSGMQYAVRFRSYLS